MFRSTLLAVTLLFAASMSCLAPAGVFAAGTLELSIGGCPGNAGAVGAAYTPADEGPDPPHIPHIPPLGVITGGTPIDCSSGQPIVLLATWSPAEALPDLLGLDGVLDFRVVGSDLDASPFWNLGPEGCGTAGTYSSHLRPGSGCSSPDFVNIWNVPGAGSSWAGLRRSADSGRLAFTAYRPTLVSVAAGQPLFGVQVVLNGGNAVEAGGSCAGCCTRFEIAWLSCRPGTASSIPTEIQHSSGAYPGFSQGMAFEASPGSCAAVPARSTTWGRLKALYR